MRDYFNFRRAMALLTVALVMSLLPTSASAQSWNKRISIHLKSVDISEFFKAINEKSGLEFISSYAEIKHSPKVSVDESDTPVRTILDKVLQGLPVQLPVLCQRLIGERRELGNREEQLHSRQARLRLRRSAAHGQQVQAVRTARRR